MKADVVTMSGHAICDKRGRNRYAVKEAIRIARMIRNGEVVGFTGAIQYADASVGVTTGGFLRPYPIAGALEAAKLGMLLASAGEDE